MSVSCWFSFLLWASICLVQAWWHLVMAASMVCWSVIVVPFCVVGVVGVIWVIAG